MAVISNKDIAKAIYLGTKDKKESELDVYLQNVVKFLARKRLMSKKEDILSKLQNIIEIDRGILGVKVSSANKLSESILHSLSSTLKKRYDAEKIILDEVINEKLIGGFKVEAKDEVIDMTTKNKLRKLQEHLNSI